MSTSQRPMSSIVLASQRGLVNPDVTQLFTRKELVGKGAYGGVYKVPFSLPSAPSASRVADPPLLSLAIPNREFTTPPV